MPPTGRGRPLVALARWRSCPLVKAAGCGQHVCGFRYADDMLPAVTCGSKTSTKDLLATYVNSLDPVAAACDAVLDIRSRA
jgi:hypothetical protein